MNRRLLVAASLEHVVRIARQVGASTEELDSLVDPAIEAAWQSRGDASLATRADGVADRLSDDLLTDLASRAAALLARGDVEGPQTLNLIDDFVDQVDPDGELGLEEEAEWRAALAPLLARAEVYRADLEPHFVEAPGWAARWQDDWDR
ncbi:MAG: hypothetical protein H6722_09240 [Sandaracinus sp.]|nr:hypothetical protein [Sandaracinus sp.]MCB9612619.1 hypothetical protein [Sandaracinus sp.]MCB9620025.1 hypothetical protein [Sandaracinus sp.]